MKVGDIITATQDHYGITDTKGTYKVVDILPEGKLRIEILSHSIMPEEIGMQYDVDAQYFRKVFANPQEAVLHKIAYLQKLFEERK